MADGASPDQGLVLVQNERLARSDRPLRVIELDHDSVWLNAGDCAWLVWLAVPRLGCTAKRYIRYLFYPVQIDRFGGIGHQCRMVVPLNHP